MLPFEYAISPQVLSSRKCFVLAQTDVSQNNSLTLKVDKTHCGKSSIYHLLGPVGL